MIDDESNTDATAEAEEPTPMQEQLVQQFGDAISNIIAQAGDNIAQDENPSLHTSTFVFDDSRDAEVNELDGMVLVQTVLGDAFHAMDRAKVSTHHDYKASHFRAL